MTEIMSGLLWILMFGLFMKYMYASFLVCLRKSREVKSLSDDVPVHIDLTLHLSIYPSSQLLKNIYIWHMTFIIIIA